MDSRKLSPPMSEEEREKLRCELDLRISSMLRHFTASPSAEDAVSISIFAAVAYIEATYHREDES